MPPRLGRRRRAGTSAARLDRDAIAELYAKDSSDRLVIVVASDEAAHDSGSIALAVARRWAAHGREILCVDADASGSALARRLGEATRSTFPPAERGLPSLMASRLPLTAELLRNHCWRLGATGTGDVWLLLGPTSASGARLAATWLAGSASSLMDANTGRSMIVSMSHPLAQGQEAFLSAASAVALVAPADTDERFDALRVLGSALNDMTERCSPCVVIDGSAVRSYEEIRTASGVHVAGQLEGVPEQVLLRNRPRRRDSKSAWLIDELAARMAFLAADDGQDEPDHDVPNRRHGNAAPSIEYGNPGRDYDMGGTPRLDASNGISTPARVDK